MLTIHVPLALVGNMVYVGNPAFGTAALQYFTGLGGYM